jgi:hypothetical protein
MLIHTTFSLPHVAVQTPQRTGSTAASLAHCERRLLAAQLAPTHSASLHDNLSEYILEQEDSTLLGLTSTGYFHIVQLRLNRPALVAYSWRSVDVNGREYIIPKCCNA